MSPEEYSRYAEIASDGEFSTLAGEKNQNTAAYGRSRTLDKRLRVFRKREPLSFVNSIAQIPTDCRMVRAISTVDGKVVRPLDEDREAPVLKDPLAKPDINDIYYVEDEIEYRLLGTIRNLDCFIEYLKQPAKPVFGYTTINNGRTIVYDPTTSTDFEWEERMEEAITSRILAQIGLSMNNGTVIQVANNSMAKE